jgi:glyoxylase-like metal-dependent hydrolase (beta-lactamase superfamily II)
MSAWNEVGAGVFVRRYEFFDQNITAIRGEGEVLVVDTRTTYEHARELQDDLRALTVDPWVVVNTHHHFDHSNGNALFLPANIWGHERCAEVLRDHGSSMLAEKAGRMPELAEAFAEVEVVPPNRTFAERATVTVGGREVVVRFFGRAHTDNDIIVVIPDAGVVLAGDLVEEGAPPSFGDAFPLEWGTTLRSAAELMTGPVVPGHGAVVDRSFAEAQAQEIADSADAARRVHGEGGSLEAAAEAMSYPAAVSRVVAERVFAQLDGSI